MIPSLPLRDIHLPPAPGAWPPAPGWWLLALLATVLVVWLIRIGWRWHAARRRRARILARFDAIAVDPDRPPVQRLAEVEALLRRAARVRHPEAATLVGGDWLRFLDGDDPAQPFSAGAGRLLADGPFRPAVDPQALAPLLPPLRRRLAQLLETEPEHA